MVWVKHTTQGAHDKWALPHTPWQCTTDQDTCRARRSHEANPWGAGLMENWL
jgi:hypothetical protein